METPETAPGKRANDRLYHAAAAQGGTLGRAFVEEAPARTPSNGRSRCNISSMTGLIASRICRRAAESCSERQPAIVGLRSRRTSAKNSQSAAVLMASCASGCIISVKTALSPSIFNRLVTSAIALRALSSATGSCVESQERCCDRGSPPPVPRTSQMPHQRVL